MQCHFPKISQHAHQLALRGNKGQSLGVIEYWLYIPRYDGNIVQLCADSNSTWVIETRVKFTSQDQKKHLKTKKKHLKTSQLLLTSWSCAVARDTSGSCTCFLKKQHLEFFKRKWSFSFFHTSFHSFTYFEQSSIMIHEQSQGTCPPNKRGKNWDLDKICCQSLISSGPVFCLSVLLSSRNINTPS